MNILIDIGHPAHVHLYKHIARMLQQRGHRVWFSARTMPIIQRLLDAENFEYRTIGRKHRTLVGKALSVIHQLFWTIGFVWRHRIDVGLSSGIVQPIAATVTHMQAVMMDDDDDAVEPWVTHIGHPLCHSVLTPQAIQRRSKHACYYAGTHELAYIHPRRFEPDPQVLQTAGIAVGECYFIVRFVALQGHHDIGERSLTTEQKERLVKHLSRYGRPIITCEGKLPDVFEPYRLPVPPEEMHHLMAYATLCVGDSQTMTSEAAVLGIPALKCNTFAKRLSVPDMLERHALCYSYQPEQFDEMLQQIDTLMALPDHGRTLWMQRRDAMLDEMTDVSAFVVDYIEHTFTKNRCRMADFTPETYIRLLKALLSSGIAFTLHHDVDRRPSAAVRIARIEQELGIRSTFFFRIHNGRWEQPEIRQIAAMGHAIGYHYESLSDCDGDLEKAYDDFCRNLESLRSLAPVEAIAPHGSPRSPHDSRDIWKHYDRHKLGIAGDRYLDTDWAHTLYLTDTGRHWDGWCYSRRDKIAERQETWCRQGLVFRHTDEIVAALQTPSHPIHRSGYSLLINSHPQRWLPMGIGWMNEYISQNVRNQVKRLYV